MAAPQRGETEQHHGGCRPVIGPTIAAVLVSTAGIGWCFVVNAVSFGFVIVSLLSLDTRHLHPVPPVPRGHGQLHAGLRYAASALIGALGGGAVAGGLYAARSSRIGVAG